MPDVGVPPVEAVAAGALVAAVELSWLLPPQPASRTDATTPTNNTRLNPIPSDPIDGAEDNQRRCRAAGSHTATFAAPRRRDVLDSDLKAEVPIRDIGLVP
jgi:hypothetical protein